MLTTVLLYDCDRVAAYCIIPLSRCRDTFYASVAKLADAPDLGSGTLRYGGSSPFARTKKTSEISPEFFSFAYFDFLQHAKLAYFDCVFSENMIEIEVRNLKLKELRKEKK